MLKQSQSASLGTFKHSNELAGSWPMAKALEKEPIHRRFAACDKNGAQHVVSAINGQSQSNFNYVPCTTN